MFAKVRATQDTKLLSTFNIFFLKLLCLRYIELFHVRCKKSDQFPLTLKNESILFSS